MPFFKYYVPVVKGKITDESGKYLGSIRFSDEIIGLGLIGRGSIIENIEENYTNQIFEYLENRSLPNQGNVSKPATCQYEINFSPTLRGWAEDSLLLGSPDRT